MTTNIHCVSRDAEDVFYRNAVALFLELHLLVSVSMLICNEVKIYSLADMAIAIYDEVLTENNAIDFVIMYFMVTCKCTSIYCLQIW